jgi:hypothetical protein
MDSRLIFRHCGGNVITRRGRRRLAESARKGNAELQEDPAGKSTGSVQSQLSEGAEGLRPRKVREVTLPRKAAKEFPTQPYPKPTQVDEVNIQRRSREHSLRN